MTNDNSTVKQILEYVNKSGTINEKRLFEDLNGYPEQPRSRDVLKTPAQTYKLCTDGDHLEPMIRNIEHAIEMTRNKNTVIHAILSLQYETGIRISEVLNIRGTDITVNRMVRIKASKGSENRVFNISSNWDFWSKYRKQYGKVFECYSRFYVYREYKKLGISFSFGIGNKMSVTHSLRHIMGRAMQDTNIDKSLIQKQLGHVNKKSTNTYMDEK